MSASLIYDMRRGSLSGVASGKRFMLRTLQDPYRLSAWEKSLASLNIDPARNLAYEAWPCRQLQPLEGHECLVFYLGGVRHHPHSGPSVLVDTGRGSFYIHGLPSCNQKLCITVADRGDELFSALGADSRVTIGFKK